MKKGLFARESLIEITVGLFLILLLAGLAYFTFAVSDAKWGKEVYAMEVVFKDVMGLRERDNVIVRGMPVGEVSGLRLDSDGVYVQLQLGQPLDMRKNYVVSIVPSSVFGGRFVRIEEGTPDFEPVPPTSVYIGEDPRNLMDDAAEVMNAARKDMAGEGGIIDNMRQATVQIRDVAERLNRGEGVLGKLLSPDEGMYDDLKKGVASIQSIVDRIERGQGALGKLLSAEDTLYEDVRASVASIREVARRLEAGEGALGKLFSADETMYSDLTNSVASVQGIVKRIERGEGTLGRLLSADDALYEDVRASVASMREVTRRLEAGEGMMGRLFSADDTLYRQLEETLNEARAVLDDVRETTPVVTFTSILFGAF